MVEQIKTKRIPWSHMQKYLETHKTGIMTYLDLLNANLIDIPEIESKLPKSFLQIYELITKIQRDNEILPKQEESKAKNVDESTAIIKKFMKLQNLLVNLNYKN